MPGSGPRRHDARQRLIAPLARRGTLLPPLHRCCPGDAERAGNAGDHAKLTPSTAAATTKSRPPSSVLRRQPRPAQPRPKPPPNQIPIDGKPPTQPPRVPSWGAFGRRPQHRWIRSRPAGIRNPTPTRRFTLGALNDGFAPDCSRRRDDDGTTGFAVAPRTGLRQRRRFEPEQKFGPPPLRARFRNDLSFGSTSR
jgi:hypothetical protein